MVTIDFLLSRLDAEFHGTTYNFIAEETRMEFEKKESAGSGAGI